MEGLISVPYWLSYSFFIYKIVTACYNISELSPSIIGLINRGLTHLSPILLILFIFIYKITIVYNFIAEMSPSIISLINRGSTHLSPILLILFVFYILK